MSTSRRHPESVVRSACRTNWSHAPKTLRGRAGKTGLTRSCDPVTVTGALRKELTMRIPAKLGMLALTGTALAIGSTALMHQPAYAYAPQPDCGPTREW